MKLPQRYVYLSLVGVGAIILCYFILQKWINTKLYDKLQELNTPNQELLFGNLSTSLISREIRVENVYYEEKDKFKATVKEMKLSGISMFNLWADKDLQATDLLITAPRIIQYSASSDTVNLSEENDDFSTKISIERFKVTDGKYILKKPEEQSLKLSLGFQGTATNVLCNHTTRSAYIPISSEDFDFRIRDLKSFINSYHLFGISSIAINPSAITLKDYKILPLLSETEFNRSIRQEQDYMRLDGNVLTIHNPHVSKRSAKAVFNTESITIDSVAFTISRNKRLADDLTYKPMYSEMLRELPFYVNIKSVKLSNSFIKYTEQPDSDLRPGLLEFHDIQLITSTISNLPDADPVKIEVQSSYMNQAKITLDWEMAINNPEDIFHIQGAIEEVEAKSMNAFIAPTLNIEAEGKLDGFYYNFKGNRYTANGESSIRYNKFKIRPVHNKAKMFTSLLTGLANMIIGDNEKKGLITEKGIEVTRDPAKSFWNYFWLCIRNGLLETIR